jgi:hypothetical protein
MNLRFHLFHFFLIAISLTSVAQSETSCRNLVTILNPVNGSELSTLYVGVNNRIAINVPGVTPENIVIKLSNGTGKLLSPGALHIDGTNGFYTAWVSFVGEVLLTVYCKENDVEKKLAEKTLQTRVIPRPNTKEFDEIANSLGLKVDSTLLSK